jgi:hypothetical protein
VRSDDDPDFDDNSPAEEQCAEPTAGADVDTSAAPWEEDDPGDTAQPVDPSEPQHTLPQGPEEPVPPVEDAVEDNSDDVRRHDRPPSDAPDLGVLQAPGDERGLESSIGNPEILETECHPPDERDVSELLDRPDYSVEEIVTDAEFDRIRYLWSPRSRFHLYTVEEVLRFPPPRWLVRGLLEQQSLSVIYGAPGEGKSFVALDIAISVSRGTSWQGREVTRGPVVYVFGEGGRGLQKRLHAWIRSNDGRLGNIFFICSPVQVYRSEDLPALATQIEQHNLKPSLVVFDTFARCFVGGDENNAKDVGEFVDALQKFLHKIGDAAALIVHHTTKESRKTERGSTALRGAADTMLQLETNNGKTTLTCTKQKDGEKGDPIVLVLDQVALPPDQDGAPVTSLVVRAGSHGSTGETMPSQAPSALAGSDQTLDPRRVAALEILSESGETGLRFKEWLLRVNDRLKEKVPPGSFRHVRERLEDDGLIERLPESRYRIKVVAK